MYFRPFDTPGAEILMDLPAGSAISTRSNSGVFTVRIGVPGRDRVQAEGGPDIPAGHRTEVVVAGLAGGRGTEQFAAHPVDGLLGLPRLTDIVVQPRHPKARLVPDPQMGLVGARIELRGEAVQPVGHCLPTAEGGHQAGDVLRHQPEVLLGVALVESVLPEIRVGPRNPGLARKVPSALRGEMKPVAGLNRFCQYCARFWNSAAIMLSPSASANREMAKSSIDHSSVIEAPSIPMIAAELVGLRRVAVLQVGGDARPLHIAAPPDTAVGRRLHACSTAPF